MKTYWKVILVLAMFIVLNVLDGLMGINMSKTFGFWKSFAHDFLYAAYGLLLWLIIRYEKD